MNHRDLTRPTVPIIYGQLILELALARGATRERMLGGLDIPVGAWTTPDARISLVQLHRVLHRAVRLTGDGGLGYEVGLRCGVTTHGLFGFAAMSLASIRQVAEFGAKFLPVRLPNVKVKLLEEGARGALEVTESTALGALRRQTIEIALIGAWRFGIELQKDARRSEGDSELWFDYPEPEYYSSYRARLPQVRFSMGANRLYFPAAVLDRPLRAGNPMTAEIMRGQCERELTLLGFDRDFLGQVREALPRSGGGYHGVDEVSARLFLSSRTLKRRLAEHHTSFRKLLDERRLRDSVRLLQDPTLAIEHIAERLAYADPANFTRAFRKWMGITPSAYRSRIRCAQDAPV